MENFNCDLVFNNADQETLYKAGITVEQAIITSVTDYCKRNKVNFDIEAIKTAFHTNKQGFLTFKAEGILFQIKFEAA